MEGGYIVMKKILVFSVILFLLISCAKKTQEKAGQNVVVLRWVSDANPARQKQIELFERANPGIKVQLDWTSGGQEKILTQIAGGKPPDLFDIYSPEQFRVFAEKNALLDITDYCKKYNVNLKDFWPQLAPYMYYKDRVYAIPTNAATIVLFYNRKIFDENNVKYPDESWTWDDLLEAAKKLTRIDVQKHRYDYFGFAEQFADTILPWAFGADFYTPDGKKCIINSPEGKKAFRFLYDMRFKYNVIPTPQQYEAIGSISGWGQGAMNLFATGRAAMILYGRWGIITFRKMKNLDWDIAPVPKYKDKNVERRATLFLSRSTAISINSPHPEEAFKFLMFLTTPEYNKLISHGGDSFPAVMSIARSNIFLFDPDFPNERKNKLYLDMLEYARVPRLSPYVLQMEVDEIKRFEMDLMWNQKQTPEQTLDNIANKVNRLIEENIKKKASEDKKE
jgi:multiple sugar transport system substrate-binding protein